MSLRLGSLVSFLATTSSSARYFTLVEQIIPIYREMAEVEGWKGQSKAAVKNFRRLFFHSKIIGVKLAFLAIARCRFGIPLKYEEDEEDLESTITDVMGIDRCLRVISETIVQCLIFPNWFYKLPIKQFSICVLVVLLTC